MSYTITNEMRRQSVTNFLRIFYIIGKKTCIGSQTNINPL